MHNSHISAARTFVMCTHLFVISRQEFILVVLLWVFFFSLRIQAQKKLLVTKNILCLNLHEHTFDTNKKQIIQFRYSFMQYLLIYIKYNFKQIFKYWYVFKLTIIFQNISLLQKTSIVK